MGWFKNICTCVGCAIGAVCIVATGGTATPLVAAAAIGIGGTAGYLIGDKQEKDEKKLKNQEQDLALKQQTIQEITKENKEANSEINKIKQERDELAKQKEKDNKDLEFAKNKANDPNLSEEDRRKWRLKVVEIEERMNQNNDKDKKLLQRIKELQDKISNNNKNISSIGSSSFNKGQGIMEFFTLQNILIALAIYALWQIVIKEDRR